MCSNNFNCSSSYQHYLESSAEQFFVDEFVFLNFRGYVDRLESYNYDEYFYYEFINSLYNLNFLYV